MKKQKLKVNSKPRHGASNRPESAGDPTFPQVLPITNSTATNSGVCVGPEPEMRATVDPAEGGDELAPAVQLSAVAIKYQEMYRVARAMSADGQIVLDRELLALSLAQTGIGSLAEQSLYSLALVAAADGNPALFKEEVVAALRYGVVSSSLQRLPVRNAAKHVGEYWGPQRANEASPECKLS